METQKTEYLPGRMASYCHHLHLRYARVSHVRVGHVPQIVENEAVPFTNNPREFPLRRMPA